jgi:predicted HTH domain antitoxin
MTVNVLTFPDEWLIENLPDLYQEHPDLVSRLLHGLLTESEELRWTLVVKAYQARDINLGKAAAFLGLHELELRDRFLELGIPLRLGPADVAEARAEVEAVRAWYGHKPDKAEQ